MPTYKHSQFIEYAIDSALKSTFKNFELIICDNNEDDLTRDKVIKFKDKRIKYYKTKKTVHAIENYNKSLHYASGKYIAFLCSDDIFEHAKCEEQIEALDNDPALACVFTQAKLIDKYGKNYIDSDRRFDFARLNVNKSRIDWIKDFFYKGNFVYLSSAMFRAKLLKKVGYHDNRLLQMHDYDFWIKLLSTGDFHVLEKDLLQYRVLHKSIASIAEPNEEKSRRSNFELSKIYESFLFFDINELHEINSDFKQIKDKKILLALLCLGIANKAGQIYGLNYIADHLNDYLDSGFSMNNYLALTGQASAYI
jgi:glycosyltransferase involved in cell wall biosynthesis